MFMPWTKSFVVLKVHVNAFYLEDNIKRMYLEDNVLLISYNALPMNIHVIVREVVNYPYLCVN